MSNFDNIPKCSCIVCKKEFYSNLLNKHIIACDKKIIKYNNKFSNLIVNDDYVVCGICNKKFIEINTAHLVSHNINIQNYDIKYPNNPRISKKGFIKKNVYVNGVSEELSKRLKKSHTLEGFIEKYGKEEGSDRYNKMINRCKRKGTKDRFIELYGEEDGIKKYNDKNNNISRAGTLEGYIERLGEEKGIEKYNEFVEKRKKARTLEGYTQRYGKELGEVLWLERNENQSRKMSKLDRLNYSNDIKEYYYLVERMTRFSFNTYKDEIDPNNLRSVDFHLDHRVSKCYGFVNKIHPVYIGSKYNLEIKSQSDNCSKSANIDLDPIELKKIVDSDNNYNIFFENYEFDFK